MQYRRLGRSGLKVSEIILGTWQTFGMTLDEAQASALARRAFDLGINTFDTADVYAKGRAESVLGEALKELPREQVVIATKAMGRVWEGPLGAGLSRKHLREALDGSLRRLQVDYVDLYQCHAPDPETSLEETFGTLQDFVRQGKVLHVGVSNYPATLLADVLATQARHGWEPVVSHQPLYNLLDREIEAELLPRCAQHGIGVIPYSPLAEGLLTGKYAGGTVPTGSRGERNPHFRRHQFTDTRHAAVGTLSGVAHEAGVPLAQLALAWVLRRPEVTGVIIGASSHAHLEDNCKASGLAVPAEVFARMDGALVGRAA